MSYKSAKLTLLLFFATSLMAGCAGGRIEGDRFTSVKGGYQFRLPGEGWAMINDGWKHQWELGYRNIYVEETFKYITRERAVTLQGQKVIIKEAEQEVDKPAHMEQRDLFKVDTAFAYRGYDLKIIIATAHTGELFRYLKENGINPIPQDLKALARHYLKLYPSIHPSKEKYLFNPDMRLNGATVDYLELMRDKDPTSILASRPIGRHIIVAYYRARGAIPTPILEKSRQDFKALIATIAPHTK